MRCAVFVLFCFWVLRSGLFYVFSAVLFLMQCEYVPCCVVLCFRCSSFHVSHLVYVSCFEYNFGVSCFHHVIMLRCLLLLQNYSLMLLLIILKRMFRILPLDDVSWSSYSCYYPYYASAVASVSDVSAPLLCFCSSFFPLVPLLEPPLIFRCFVILLRRCLLPLLLCRVSRVLLICLGSIICVFWYNRIQVVG